MHTVRVLLWFGTSQFYPYPSGLLPWHWDNHNASYASLKNAGKSHKSATTSQADVDALVQNWGNSIDNTLEWPQSCAKPLILYRFRDDSRFAPSQWETVLLCNTVSHWLGASLESALALCKTAETSLLTQWSYCSLAQSHQYNQNNKSTAKTMCIS